MHLHFFPHIFLHHRRIFVHYFLSYIDDKRQRELKISNNRVNSYYKQSLEWSTKIVKPQLLKTWQKNEYSFDAQRSKLHWHLKQASLALEAGFIFLGVLQQKDKMCIHKA